MLTTDGLRPARSRIGLYDNGILCAECDAAFGPFDDYACKQLLHWPTRQGLLREADGLIARGERTRYAGYRLRPDVDKIQRFAASLLWRAAISGRPEFAIAPEKATVEKAEALLRGGGTDCYLGLFARRLDNQRLSKFVSRPVLSDGDFGESVEFGLSGFLLSIMGDIPPTSGPIFLGAADEWWIKFEPFFGSHYELALRDMKQSADQIPTKRKRDA